MAAQDDPLEAELQSWIGKLDAKQQKLVASMRTALRKRFPTANELAYDYPDSLVLSYSPSERGIDAVLALSARATGVTLHFNQGPQLPDPKGLLQGSGKAQRFIAIASASQLKDPDVSALIEAAVEHAPAPLASVGRGKLVIKESARKKAAAKSEKREKA